MKRKTLSLLLVVMVLGWITSQGIRAAAERRTASTAPAATLTTPAASADVVVSPVKMTAHAAKPVPAPAAAPSPAPQSQKKPITAQNVGPNGQNYKMRGTTQAQRNTARAKQAPQKRGVKGRYAGVSTTTATYSSLATVGTSAVTTLATMAAANSKPDYFGIPNYANSPLPQIDANGNVVPGTGIQKFVNTLPGFCGLSPWGTKGVNELGQCLPIVTPDTTTFPGSDFYRLAVHDYKQQLHSSLPATTLRGYVTVDANGTPVGQQQYLGPFIVATRNKPVRFLFTNELGPNGQPGTTGGGNLFVPVDTTYMGAGMVMDSSNHQAQAAQNRAVIHLHGGNSPWISDGTPHQWITPAGDQSATPYVGFAKGFSFQNVPDMPVRLGFTPGLVDGKGTYLYTNEQSGRLMFYHDHSYGTTRLNVYAGSAAGYLLIDPDQESQLASATVPGILSTDPTTGVVSGDVAHVVPLVIQDKTFVPDNGDAGGQLAAMDPTWDVANWGGKGSLWFPHVYMPNQNPADLSGANPFGRWDYGPWFWPPQNASTFVASGQPYSCSSIATPSTGWAFGPLMCPGTPLPAGVPEGFMDTPVVNGTAYPKLTVDPVAYRFHVLNAANDRTLNLGLYVATPVTVSVTAGGTGYSAATTVTINDPTGSGITATPTIISGVITGITTSGTATTAYSAPTVTIADTTGKGAAAIASANSDVRMVPAVSAASRTLPDCTTSLPMAAGGLVTTNLTTANGLPANCWPTYVGGFIWPTDGRDGGVPDPLTAGPPIIQIGSEGGLLPSPAVIPSTPVSYDYNKRSITVLNVLNHGLYMGPAERAEIVVDFSQFAGQTLILYNDAPAPVPAGDPRNDYYTNGPDNSPTGGAPSTIAGYGPNTRTIMQIVVNGAGSGSNVKQFSLASLTGALPNIFATTQDDIIVPETAYPAANGGAGSDTYLRIQDTSISAWIGTGIGNLTLNSGGAGYTATPTVTISAPTTLTGTTASATAALAPTGIASPLKLVSGGSGYTSAPAVTIAGGGGSGATATAGLAPTGVASVTLTNKGSKYTTAPTVTFSAPQTAGGTTAVGTATVSKGSVASVTITNPGSGYTAPPTVTFTGGGSGAAGTSVLRPAAVGSLTLTNAGTGYTSAPTVSFSGGGGTGATATASLVPTVVASLTVTDPGSGYRSAPTVTISAPQTTGSTASATASAPVTPLQPKTIQELFTLDYGRMNATLGVEVPFTNFNTQTTIPYGYVDPPTEIFKDGETQLWKITHNGVDTHFIHFHLFTVQVINRVGWDGAIKPPDPDEMSLKDTVRMNPLEDVIVALRPLRQTDALGITNNGVTNLPFQLPNSVRPLDVTQPVGAAMANEFTNIDPTNQPATVTNDLTNFGWEYVWHCHILGHEENDMMRAMTFVVAPAMPGIPTAALVGSGNNAYIGVSWKDNAINETGFTVQRATSATGPWTTLTTAIAPATGTGLTVTYNDTTAVKGTTYYYRVIANNLVGYTKPYAAPAVGYPNISGDSAPTTASNGVKR